MGLCQTYSESTLHRPLLQSRSFWRTSLASPASAKVASRPCSSVTREHGSDHLRWSGSLSSACWEAKGVGPVRLGMPAAHSHALSLGRQTPKASPVQVPALPDEERADGQGAYRTTSRYILYVGTYCTVQLGPLRGCTVSRGLTLSVCASPDSGAVVHGQIGHYVPGQ